MRLALYIGNCIQSYENEVIATMHRISRSRGYQLDIFANCVVPDGDYLHIEGLKKVFSLSNIRNYDGIISADDTLHNYEMNIDLRKHLGGASCPVVCLRNSVDGCYNVVFDDRQAMYNMTKHLISTHHCKDIGFVTGSFALDDTTNRLSGFMDAMLEAGLIIDEETDIFHGNYWNNQGDKTAEFFINREKGLPEAIICSNDYMALALIESLKKLGIRCPEDVLITGLDNVPEGNETIPMLTTIDFDVSDMCEAAVDIIEHYHIDLTRLKKKKHITGKCIYRSSCGCMDLNEFLVQNYEMMRDLITEEHNNAVQCVHMNMQFGSVLDMSECIQQAIKLLRNTNRYKHIYAIIKNQIYAEAEENKNMVFHNNSSEKNEVSVEYPITKSRDQELAGNTNVFFPINCQDELYGYFVIQLKDDINQCFDVVTSQLLIMVGNTLKKLELLSLQGELEDIKVLYQQDPLTGLYNRRGFENRIRKLYETENGDENSISKNSRVIISSIDVDGLKYINDNFGHYEGDRAIKAVADCIREVLKEDEFAARIGGDEFYATILLTDENEDKNEFRDKLYDAVKRAASRFTKYSFGISVGLAEISSYRHILEGMKESDKDMYREKKIHHSKR